MITFPSLSYQATCLEDPSTVQAGRSRCQWTADTSSCDLRPPPVDPIFTILVALLTLIISNVPIGIIQYVLLQYCSKSPGERTEQFIEGMQKKSTVSLDPGAAATTAEGLSNDTPAPPRTEFGDVIRRRVSEGSGGFISASDQAQYAFAGK
jgi:hypothetical protein